jgi:hypothetical protein
MGRPAAVLDRAITANEDKIAIHSDSARKIAEVVREHVFAAERLNEVALTDSEAAIATYASVERALRAARVWMDLPADVRSGILAMELQLRAVSRDCSCVDRETHVIGCKLHTIYRSHRELIERYRAHNVALVSGKVSA